MAKRKIVDTVADALVAAELGIVRTARQAVQAVNLTLGARPKARKAKRKITGTKKAAKKPRRSAARKPSMRRGTKKAKAKTRS